MKSIEYPGYSIDYIFCGPNILVVLLFVNDMILHTSPNNCPPLWMWNEHQKLPIYQIIILFNVDLPPQVMNLLLS